MVLEGPKFKFLVYGVLAHTHVTLFLKDSQKQVLLTKWNHLV